MENGRGFGGYFESLLDPRMAYLHREIASLRVENERLTQELVEAHRATRLSEEKAEQYKLRAENADHRIFPVMARHIADSPDGEVEAMYKNQGIDELQDYLRTHFGCKFKND